MNWTFIAALVIGGWIGTELSPLLWERIREARERSNKN